VYEFRHINDLIHPRWTDLRRLGDTQALETCLVAGGLHERSLGAVAAEVRRCCECMDQAANPTDRLLAGFVPGRIEVLGKHTDYAGGGSLICTVQRGFAVVANPRDDSTITVTDAATGDRVELRFDPDEENRPEHWSDYAITAARRLSRDFPIARTGLDIVFSSNLPRASGMSSSSALTVAISLLLIQVNRLADDETFASLFEHGEDLAQYLGALENGLPYLTLEGDTGVGTFGGSEDHTAILCSQPGLMKWYSYSPVRFHEAVAIPDGHVFALGFTGVHAPKNASVRERYNYLSDSTAAVAAAWRAVMDRDEPHLGAISAIPGYSRTEVALAIREMPGDRYSIRQLTDRLDHFHHENNLILPGAVGALEDHDLNRFGELVDRSQHLAETLLQNQTEETKFLTRSARKAGAVAASAFGGGFGGSVWALVCDDDAESFIHDWSEHYLQRFPEAGAAALFFVDTPGPAAFQLGEPEMD
jgi:galactokinase